MTNYFPSKFVSLNLALFMFVFTGGCHHAVKKSPNTDTAEAAIAATPEAIPQRSITNFSESLSCMDNLLGRYGINNLTVGAEEVADRNSVIAGTKDMLMTALSTMSRTSKAISVVALAQDLSDVSRFHSLHAGKSFSAPNFFIRLSAPQIDKGVDTHQIGGGVRVQDALSVEYSQDRIASILSLDLNAGLVSNLQLLPGVYSSNSIAVVRRGKATDVSGEIRKLGAIFYVSDDTSEGFHHSARTLVELGAIEVVGRLTQTPYWECLDINSTNPKVQKQIKEWYSGYSWEQLAVFVQQKLTAKGLYDGEITTEPTPAFNAAVARYKADAGLIADSQLTYLLYYKLVLDPTPISQPTLAFEQLSESTGTTIAPVQVEVPGQQRLKPLKLELESGYGDTNAVYKSGEYIQFTATTSTDAHLYCYYQQGDGSVIKIFPNRFSPNSKTVADVPVFFPQNEHYKIRADTPGSRENIMCIAAYTDIDQKLPFALKEKDMQKLPVSSLDKVYAYYKAVSDITPLKETINIEVF